MGINDSLPAFALPAEERCISSEGLKKELKVRDQEVRKLTEELEKLRKEYSELRKLLAGGSGK